MLALRKVRAGFGIDIVEMEQLHAPPAAGEVRVAVAAVGICGSDLHAFEWTDGYGFMEAHMPLTLGHEFSGAVVAVGAGVGDLQVGNRVVCWPTVPCKNCAGCLAGRPEECRNRTVIGLHRNGAFCEQLDIPAANCFKIPDRLNFDLAALAEPLGVAVNAVDLAEVSPGDRVVVLGPGPIGLAAAFVAQTRGAEVLIAGFNDAARLACSRSMGIAHQADLTRVPLAEAVTSAFGTEADRLIEATGRASSVRDGLAVLRPGGILVVAGIHKEPCELDLTRLVREKKQMRGAHDTTRRAFLEAIALLVKHGDQLQAMITHRLPLADASHAFEIARARTAVKVLMMPAPGLAMNHQEEVA